MFTILVIIGIKIKRTNVNMHSGLPSLMNIKNVLVKWAKMV